MSELFRETAVDRLSSPEGLDTLMRITTPRAWVALLALVAVLGGATVWGVFGHAPDTMEGTGILLRRGGLFEVATEGAGRISELLVKPGDRVRAGQVVARLSQPELERTISQTEALIADLTRNGQQRGQFIGREKALGLSSLNERLRQIEHSADALREQVRYLEHRRDAQAEALKAGLIAGDAYQGTVQELARVRDVLAGLDTERRQIAARKVELDNDAGQRVFSLDQEVLAQQRQLELLQDRYAATAQVESPYSGLIVEQRADPGDLVAVGQVVFALELADEQLDSVVFVPMEGKQLKPGMQVQLSPAGVAWEDYGYMLGTVRSVSLSPASSASMNELLRNDTLVRQFADRGGAYMVTVDLFEDPGTPSGFKWTTRRGPDLQLGGGTLLGARFVLREERPITLVIPALRRWLGV
ncbi:MAG TPA: NHLP bacteriocin system secretion protein [Vicinamibacterales bacterium]|nr:NHLP bacteriocin system secretion protein [Acidobacteriota bacterium]HOC17347.1 NHLP bacteriocin system secretion protein [Vicinamibacterales bacterium]